MPKPSDDVKKCIRLCHAWLRRSDVFCTMVSEAPRDTPGASLQPLPLPLGSNHTSSPTEPWVLQAWSYPLCLCTCCSHCLKTISLTLAQLPSSLHPGLPSSVTALEGSLPTTQSEEVRTIPPNPSHSLVVFHCTSNNLTLWKIWKAIILSWSRRYRDFVFVGALSLAPRALQALDEHLCTDISIPTLAQREKRKKDRPGAGLKSAPF